MKIKILDIHSESGEQNLGYCETCEYWETYNITSVEIQEVGTDNVDTVVFDHDNETVIDSWKFADWVKFNDWLNEFAFESHDTLAVTFEKLSTFTRRITMPNNRHRRVARLRTQKEWQKYHAKQVCEKWASIGVSTAGLADALEKLRDNVQKINITVEVRGNGHVHGENCTADNCEACRPFNYALTKSVEDAKSTIVEKVKRGFAKVVSVFK